MLYLNLDERMARVQVAHRLAGRPYGIEDLDPAEQHDLVTVKLTGRRPFADWFLGASTPE